MNQILNFLLPPFCSVCRALLEERAVLCGTCTQHIKPIVSYSLTLSTQYTIAIHALSDYQMPLKKLIVAKRYGNSVASRQLGRLMALRAPMQCTKYDAIIPVPLHWFRYARRGYNQSQEIANELHKNYQIPVYHLLQRSRHTAYQTGMSKEERTINIKNAFVLSVKNKFFFKDKRLLLIDDVITTGETVRMAAKELATLKPASIDVFVACRVV